jgi:acyl-coenzyme A thioesterase PaaI-like protein
MQSLRPEVAALLSVTRKAFAENSFTPLLGTNTADLVSVGSDDTVFKMKIPARICEYIPGRPAALRASSALALFDELSSLGFMIHDKTMRGGVSTVLSTELLHDVVPGTEVTIQSIITKSGKSIGYSDMYMYDDVGRLVATGYHTKYLPMGQVWDIIAHPRIAPYSIHAFQNWSESIKKSKFGRYIMATILKGQNRSVQLRPEYLENVGGAFDAFGMKETRIDRGDGEIDGLEMDVKPYLCNVKGYLHGGACGMVAEHAARLLIVKSGGDPLARITRVDMQYQNAMQVHKHLNWFLLRLLSIAIYTIG